MKRKLIHFSLLITMLLGLLPGTVRAQEAGAAKVYLPFVASQTTQNAAAVQSAITSVKSPPPSGPRIEINLLSVLLTGEHNTEELVATIYGEKDQVVSDTVTWENDDPDGVIKLEVNGNLAKVYSSGQTGSATVTAFYGKLKLQRSVPIIFAPLQDHTRLIDPTLVRYDLSTPDMIFLTRTPETELIEPNMVLVSNGVDAERPGLLVHVVKINHDTDPIEVRVQTASVPEAFVEFRSRVVGDPIDVQVGYPPGWGSAPSQSQAPNSIPDWCHVTLTGTVTLDVRLLTLPDHPFELRPVFEFHADWQGVQHVLMAYEVTTNLTLTGPTVLAGGHGSASIECALDLPVVNSPVGLETGIPGVDITPRIAPTIGLRGSIALDGSVTLKTVTLSYTATGRYGIQYDRDGNGWTKIEEHQSSGPQVSGPELTTAVQLTASLTPFFSGLLGLQFNLFTQPFFIVNLVEAEFSLTGTVVVPGNALIPPPNLAHGNPTWKVEVGIEVTLKLGHEMPILPPELPGEPLELPNWLNLKIFEHTGVVGQAPGFKVSTAWINTNTLSMTVAPIGSFGWLERLVYEGQPVKFFAIQENGTSSLIGSGVVDANGQATNHWSFPPRRIILTTPLVGTQWNIPVTGTVGNRYTISIAHPATQPAVAVLLHSTFGDISCATGNGQGTCSSPPSRPTSTAAMTVGISAPQFRPEHTGTVTVADLGPALYQIVAVVNDKIFAPVGLVYMTAPEYVH